MRSRPTSTPPAGWLRQGLTFLLLLAALVGTLELHPGGEGLGRVAFAAEERVAECHPGLALHLDAPVLVLHPECPACLFHQGARGGHLPPGLGVSPSPTVCRVLDDSPSHPRPFPGYRISSRGPPPAVRPS